MERALNPDKFELGEIVEPQNHWAAKNFKCGACGCLPLNPVLAPASAECDHVFCDSCSHAPWCELCGKGLPSDERPPLSRVIAKCYAELPVRCPHWSAHSKLGASEGWDSSFGETDTCADDQETTDGEKETADKEEQVRHLAPPVPEKPQCGWTGAVQELRSHLLECPFQLIQCPSGIVLRRKDTDYHRQTDCPCTFENCPICDERVKVGTMEHHRAEKAKEHATLLEEKLKEQAAELEKSRKRAADLEKQAEERETDLAESEKPAADSDKERETDLAESKKPVADLEKKVKDPRRSVRGNWGYRLAAFAALCFGLYVAWLVREERDIDLEKSKTDAGALKKKLEERDIDLEKSKTDAGALKKKLEERDIDLERSKTDAGALKKKLEERDIDLEKSKTDTGALKKKLEERDIDLEKSKTDAGALKKKLEERETDLKKCKEGAATLEKKVKERDVDLEKSKTDAAALKEKLEEQEKAAADLEKKVQEREIDLEQCRTDAAASKKKVEEQELEVEKLQRRSSELEVIMKDREAERQKEFSQLEAKMKTAADSTFEWEIQNPVKFKAEHPKVDDRTFSPEFFLRGLGPWTVCIKPSGDSREPGGVGAFLHGSASTASARVEARLTINGILHTIPEIVYGGDSGRGLATFPGLAWPTTNDKPVRVQVDLLKVTHVAITK